MLRFEVEFYEEKGKYPVEEFLKNLIKKEKIKIYKFIDLLEEKGLEMPYGYCKKLTHSELWELKIDYGTNTFRIFYIYDNNKIILLHAIRKKTNETPISDLKLAEKRMNDYFKNKRG